jgi:hypothetical protein
LSKFSFEAWWLACRAHGGGEEQMVWGLAASLVLL